MAPTPAAVLFSAVMSDLGLYAVAEIYRNIFAGPFGGHAHAVRAVLLSLGAVTALLTAVMCVLQRHLKRLLAFATIIVTGFQARSRCRCRKYSPTLFVKRTSRCRTASARPEGNAGQPTQRLVRDLVLLQQPGDFGDAVGGLRVTSPWRSAVPGGAWF